MLKKVLDIHKRMYYIVLVRLVNAVHFLIGDGYVQQYL